MSRKDKSLSIAASPQSLDNSAILMDKLLVEVWCVGDTFTLLKTTSSPLSNLTRVIEIPLKYLRQQYFVKCGENVDLQRFGPGRSFLMHGLKAVRDIDYPDFWRVRLHRLNCPNIPSV